MYHVTMSCDLILCHVTSYTGNYRNSHGNGRWRVRHLNLYRLDPFRTFFKIIQIEGSKWSTPTSTGSQTSLGSSEFGVVWKLDLERHFPALDLS